MDKTELLRGAQAKQASEEASSLRSGTVLEVVAGLDQNQVAIVRLRSPVRKQGRRCRRGGRSRGRRLRSHGQRLIVFDDGGRQARGWWSARGPGCVLLKLLNHVVRGLGCAVLVQADGTRVSFHGIASQQSAVRQGGGVWCRKGRILGGCTSELRCETVETLALMADWQTQGRLDARPPSGP